MATVDGGVHSHNTHVTHLYALLETAKEVGVPHVYALFSGDRHDTTPCSAASYAHELLDYIQKATIPPPLDNIRQLNRFPILA